MLRFLISMSGAQADILERFPAEKARYAGLGAVVLATGVVSAAYLALGLRELASIAPAPAIVAGLILAFLFISLDRWFMMSAPVRPHRAILALLPRILLGVLLGLILSTALIFQIFKEEINVTTTLMRKLSAASFEHDVANSQLSRQIIRLQYAISNYQRVVDSNGKIKLNPLRDGVLTSANARLIVARKAATTYFQKYQCQLYGGPGCGTVAGNGPIAAADHAKYLLAVQKVASLLRQIRAREELLTGETAQDEQFRVREARQNLPGASSLLHRDEAMLQAELAAFRQAYDNPPGLLTKLEALNQLAARNTTVGIAWLMVALLTALVECLPVAARLLMPQGRYERAAEAWRQSEALADGSGYDAFRRQALEEIREGEEAGPIPPGRTSRWASAGEGSEDLALRTMRDMRPAGGADDHLPPQFPAT